MKLSEQIETMEVDGNVREKLRALALEVKALEDRADRLENACESFAEMAEAAIAHHERGKGGQQVPFHGDFAHVPPSAVRTLRWWAV